MRVKCLAQEHNISLSIINYFVSITISLTNLVFVLILHSSEAPVVPVRKLSLEIVLTPAHLWHNTISFTQEMRWLRTFARKNFPHTDFFKTLTDGRK